MYKLKCYFALSLSWLAVQLIKTVYWLMDGTEVKNITVDDETFYPFFND
jgi:L-lactate permease